MSYLSALFKSQTEEHNMKVQRTMERRRMYLAMQEKERAEMGPDKYDKLRKANDNIQIDTNQEF